jgi:hypothetical protein
MPEPPERPATHVTPEVERYGEPAPPPASPVAVQRVPRARRRPGALARLISLIVSVGLAWALVVAITAWLLGLFLARG